MLYLSNRTHATLAHAGTKVAAIPLFVALFLGFTLTAVTPENAEAKTWGEDWDGDGLDDHTFRDADNDGHPESCTIDWNGDTLPDVVWEDRNDDGKWDMKWYYDGSGTPYEYSEDTDFDGDFDTSWYDGGIPPGTMLWLPENLPPRDGVIQTGELFLRHPDTPVPTEPTPRTVAAPDCTGDPGCGPLGMQAFPIVWMEDQVPIGPGDGISDHFFSDSENDGIVEWAGQDVNQDGILERWFFDANGDGVWDMEWEDTNFDELADIWSWDSDGDQMLDTWWLDVNLDGVVQFVEIESIDPPEPVTPEPISILPGPPCDSGLDPCPVAHQPQPPATTRNHERGTLALTVTAQGTLGFLDATQSQGLGLIYPSDASNENHLFIGGVWLAHSNTYLASRDYEADPHKDWVVETVPDGQMWPSYEGNSDEDLTAGYSDDGSVDPFGFYIRQESWAFDSGSDSDDFVIVRYFIHNTSEDDLTSLRFGVFADLDLLETPSDDEGGTDPDRNLAYLSDPSGTHLGIRLLEGDVSTPANVTLIHNPTYVWPNEYIVEADKFGLISASDPSYVLPSSSGPDDYSLLVSVGPFTLASAESTEVAFAIVGGASLPDLQANSDLALETHNPTTGIDGHEVEAAPTRTQLASSPNPFSRSTAIRFRLPEASDVSVIVYDALGRRIRSLASGRQEAGGHEAWWDGRSESGQAVGSGVYFIKLDTDEESATRSVTLLR